MGEDLAAELPPPLALYLEAQSFPGPGDAVFNAALADKRVERGLPIVDALEIMA